MSQDNLITLLVAMVLIPAVVFPYYLRRRREEKVARHRFEKAHITGQHLAVSLHPQINALACMGCGGCVEACPEDKVLGVIDGKAVLLYGSRCVGHGVCVEACPVGAIALMMTAPGRSANLPVLNSRLETSVSNMFIAGELGGLGLIKNAMTQGKNVVEYIATRPRANGSAYDVGIVGAGPAGLAAALTAKANNLTYILLDQGDAGGTILQYPRQKIVMTSPVDLPLWGKLNIRETSKESLLDLWQQIFRKTQLKVNANEKVLDIVKTEHRFHLTTSKEEYAAAHVVLALGRRGTPQKLGVPGEELSKVTYRLMDAETYQNRDVLVVGGGDSAVEAAMGLAMQGTNRVTLSYRKNEFTRLKERNVQHLRGYVKRNAINVVFNSSVRRILPKEVHLETSSGPQVIPNEFVFIFAGGEMPFEFLKKIGVVFQNQAFN